MQARVRLPQALRVLAAIAVAIGGGTVAFHATLHESWFQSFYRAIVTASLAGLDTVPATNGARVVSIVLVLCRA